MLIPKYVLKVKEKDVFISIDTYSGGYPFEVSVERAKIWYDEKGKQDALDYKSMFSEGKNWELHKLIIRTFPTK